MDSGFRQQQHQHHFQDQRRQLHQQKQQMNSGLTRFRSAPSSYFASFLDAAADTINSTTTPDAGGGGGQREDFSNARPLSPETEKIFANFMSSMGGESNSSSNQKLCDIPENSAVQQDFMVQVKQERETQQQQQHYHHHQQHQQGNYSTSSQQMIYQSQSKPPLANQNTSAMENPFRSTAATSMGMHSLPQMSNNNNNNNNNNTNSSLTRHSSSPAGFFNSILLDIDNGYGATKGMGNYGANTGETNFSQGQPSSTSGLMTQNSDIAGKRFSNSTNNNSSNNDRNYISGYPMSSWDDSILSENFSSLDRGGEDDGTQSFSELNASENQSEEGRNCPQPLAHHLSLPSSSAMEKMLQFQDTVPCRIRAKRGCATHPRSIAERVRRTRISERMRKLQDLVPSMDKQTNTADMLDLAVEYIKDLQNQVKNLNDQREKCTCSK